MKGITLIGMAGVGKSVVGRSMAEKIGWQFVDMDKLILKKQGITHHQYMETNGEEALKILEERYALELNLEDTIFAPPGSIIYSPKSMEKVKRESAVVYLEAPPEIILKHLGENLYKNGIIGLKEKGLAGVMAERIPLYERYADFTFHCAEQTPEEMAEILIDGLKTAGYAFSQHQ